MLDAKWWLVSYDVHDPKRLRRAATVLEGASQRIQFSVFRCWMTPAQMQELRWELTQVLDPDDELLLIPSAPGAWPGWRRPTPPAIGPTGPSSPTSSGSCEGEVPIDSWTSTCVVDSAGRRSLNYYAA